ncbi:MAG: recombinase family protein [Desulfosporosinus sp.]|nr:recombinase family protein [Desulfosporosinus sp.]
MQYVRQLKEKNIAIFFEKENVNTLDSKGEFLITLLGSLAQEESSNISQITRMGIAYRFQEGKVIVNHNRFLGYTKDENGELVIVPEEAEIIRRIYREFMKGKSPYKIAAGLERDGVITGSGGSRWYDSTVDKILKNEKYMGEALLQKTFTVDFLTKKRVKNNGQAAQYYVEDSHTPMVSKEELAAVQMELKDRRICVAIPKRVRANLLVTMLFLGSCFTGIAVRNSGV